jgi:hypothetical protein
MSVTHINVLTLSDSELVSMLRDRGTVCGPIIDQTRRVYQRKLQRLLNAEAHIGSGRAPDVSDNSDDDDSDNDGVEDEDANTQWGNQSGTPSSSVNVEYNDSVRWRSTVGTHSHGYSLSDQGGDYPTSPKSGSTASTQSSSLKVAAAPKTGPPVWLKLLLLAIVMTIVFLIIHNMEPAYTPPEIRDASSM